MIRKQKSTKTSDHLNSGDVWIAVLVEGINQPRQNMIDRQCAVVQHNYQSFVLQFTHTIHNHVLSFIHSPSHP